MNLVFAGTPEFAARHLEAILASDHQVLAVITQPDKPGKRGRSLVASPVKTLAENHNLPLLQPDKLTPDDFASFDPDVLVVVAYGQILSKSVLSLPRKGCVNVHASYLPRWRGAAPVQRAILAGDETTGVTLIQMDAGLDTGDILAAESVRIADDDTAGSLSAKLEQVGTRLLLSTLNAIEEDRAETYAQDDALSTYAGKIDKDEARISWRDDASDIARKVRAFNPEPIAFSHLADMRIKIHSARTIEKEREEEPGKILSVTSDGVEVACQRKVLLITGLQLPVGKGAVLTGRDILNARSDLIYPGACLS